MRSAGARGAAGALALAAPLRYDAELYRNQDGLEMGVARGDP